MDTAMTTMRLELKARERDHGQRQIYRWVGLCAMLAIACLVLLSLVF